MQWIILLKQTVYDKLVTKVNAIDTSRFALRTQQNTDKSGLEKKINDADKETPNTRRLVKKQIIMLRSLRLKVKYPVLLAQLLPPLLMQLKIRYPTLEIWSNKTDYDANISDIGAKYFTTFDYSKFTGEI